MPPYRWHLKGWQSRLQVQWKSDHRQVANEELPGDRHAGPHGCAECAVTATVLLSSVTQTCENAIALSGIPPPRLALSCFSTPKEV